MSRNILQTLSKKKNLILYYSIFFLFIFFFTTIYFLSLFKVVNFWTFSQAHVNYFDGYLKRGLFGTIMITLEEFTNISTRKIFSWFFIFLTTVNIILFFKILKKYINHYIIFIFLALNPTLMIFSFNDLGGYQRFDSISVFLILLHSYITEKNYSEKYYRRFFFNLIILIFAISLFIHEGIAFSLPFHIFLSYRIFKKKYKNYLPYFILVTLTVFVFLKPSNSLAIKSIEATAKSRDLWSDAMLLAAGANTSLNDFINQFNINFVNIYNLKINLFFITISLLPLTILFIKKNLNNLFIIPAIFFILSPYLLSVFIGDVGRWINVMSFQILGIFYQYNVNYNNYEFFKNKIISKILIVPVLILCFFIRMPHCCDLEKKGITIWGGISSKLISYINIFKKNNDDFYNLNKRFKN